jgi:hypothetical protein
VKPEDLPALASEVFPSGIFNVRVCQVGALNNDLDVRVSLDLMSAVRPHIGQEAADVKAELLAQREGFIEFCIGELSKLRAAK